MKYFLLNFTIRLTCLFPIITFCIDNGLNRFLFAAIFFLVLVIFLVSVHFRYCFCGIIALIGILYSYIYTENFTQYYENIGLMFYYPFFLLYTSALILNRNILYKVILNGQRFFFFIVYLFLFLVILSSFFSSSYFYKEAGTLFFGGFVGDTFRAAPASLFIHSLVVILGTLKKKRFILYHIVLFIVYLFGSSRTYLFLGVILLMIHFLIFYSYKKFLFFGGIGFFCVLSFIFCFEIQLPIINKILYTFEYDDKHSFLFYLSSSRTTIWSTILSCWWELTSSMDKFLGCGIFFSLNSYYGLWSHNDFIEILVSFGVTGLLFYLCLNFILLSQVPNIVIKFLLFLLWFFNAMFNMYYTYMCCLLSFPIIVIFFTKYNHRGL